MPESKELGGSLFQAVSELEKRVTTIENQKEKTDYRLTTLEEKYEKLSDTITSENRETRATMRDTTDKLFAIITKQTQQKGAEDEREFNLEEKKLELKKANTNLLITNIFKLTGAGGILYVIIESLLAK